MCAAFLVLTNARASLHAKAKQSEHVQNNLANKHVCSSTRIYKYMLRLSAGGNWTISAFGGFTCHLALGKAFSKWDTSALIRTQVYQLDAVQ